MTCEGGRFDGLAVRAGDDDAVVLPLGAGLLLLAGLSVTVRVERGGARVEVEVFPAQAEEFALAESGVEGEFEQRVQPVSARSREELAGFVGGGGRRGGAVGCRSERCGRRCA